MGRMDADGGGLIAALFEPDDVDRGGLHGGLGKPWIYTDPDSLSMTANGTTVDIATGGQCFSAADALPDDTVPAHRDLISARLGITPGVGLTYGRECLFGNDKFIFGDGANWHQATPTVNGVGTDDFCVEALVYSILGGGDTLFANRQNASAGWNLYTHTDGTLRALIYNGSALPVVLINGIAHCLTHAMFFVDRDSNSLNGMRSYRNGVPFSNANPFACTGNLTGAGMAILSLYLGGGGAISSDGFAWGVMRHAPSWWPGAADNPSLWNAIAAERARQVLGYQPRVTVSGAEAITNSRTTRQCYIRQDPDNKPVVQHVCDRSIVLEGIGDDQGLNIWGQWTNLATYYDPRGAGGVLNMTESDGGQSPDVEANWCDLTETAATGGHGQNTGNGAGSALSMLCSGGQWMTSLCLFKPGIRRYVEVVNWDASFGGAEAAFMRLDTDDMSVLEAGHVGSIARMTYVDHEVDDLGNGVYLLRLIGYCAVADNRVFTVFGAATDDAYTATESYAGNTSGVAFSVLGHTVVAGNHPYYGPPIWTSGSTELKDNDDIVVPYSIIPSPEFSISCEIKRHFTSSAPFHFPWSLSDGTTSNRLDLYVRPTTGYVEYLSTDGGVPQSTLTHSSDINDGDWHEIVCAARDGRFALQVDGGTIQTASGSLSSALDQFNIGNRAGAAGTELSGRLRNLRIYNRSII